jgi:hypothetical protein
MGSIKTRATQADVVAFLASVPNERRRADGLALLALMQDATGVPPVMWGSSIVGFGSRPYTNTTGTNDWFVVGFSPRKTSMTLYGVHDGYGPPDPLLAELGPHTTGKGCLYIKQLSEVDEGVLRQLVLNAWEQAHRSS